MGPKQDDHKATNLETQNKQGGLKSTNHESQTMTFWTRASKHMFPKRFTKMINGTENLKFAKRKAWYKEFRSKSQTVGTALNVKRTYKWHSKHKRRYRWTNLKKIEMDCNCGFRKLISLTVSYSKFPFCCLQHLKLGDIFVSHEADILSFTSTMQFLHFHGE